MAVEKREYFVPSGDGIHTLSGVIYLPEGTPKGYFHAVHGMTEHIARYDTFLTEMAQAGFVAFGYDHVGHGKTAREESELGYIAAADGWKLLAKDVKIFSDAVRREIGKDLPYYLMGHSMGSFAVRVAAERYVQPDRLILMGTGGANPAAGAGLALVALVKTFRGEKYFSPLVDALAFGSYNKRFGGGSEDDPKPWLTRDEAVRAQYYADPFCSFHFTVSAMGDLIRLTKEANRGAWYRNLPKELPILLVSGAEDPVGAYGKGIRQVERKLKAKGILTQAILYEDARHEILNDTTHAQTVEDILRFLA